MKLSKIKLVGVALFAVAIMMFAGCSNGSTDSDDWSAVTNTNDLIGVWEATQNTEYGKQENKLTIESDLSAIEIIVMKYNVSDAEAEAYVDMLGSLDISLDKSNKTVTITTKMTSNDFKSNVLPALQINSAKDKIRIVTEDGTLVYTKKSGSGTSSGSSQVVTSDEKTVDFPNTDGKGEGSAVQIVTAAEYAAKGNVTKVKITCTDVTGGWVCVMGKDWEPKKEGAKEYEITEAKFLNAFKANGIWLGGKKGTSLKYKIEYTIKTESTGGSTGDNGNGNDNTQTSTDDPSKLASPKNVKFEGNVLSWDVVSGAAGYVIYYGDTEDVEINTNKVVESMTTSDNTGRKSYTIAEANKTTYANKWFIVVAKTDTDGRDEASGNKSVSIQYKPSN